MIEEESKRDIFDIDSALNVDYNFQEYRKFVQDTTLIVERFWYLLINQNYYMFELLELGKKIVDQFLVIKDTYEMIITEKPDHREAILLSIQFNQNVLNFEVEAFSTVAYLKNIDQKMKISK